MRRWTNGLPGATQRLGAMMTQRGLTASQPWMRADPHRGPEHNRSTSEAEYIDAAFTFALSELHLAPHGRAIHLGTTRGISTSPGACRGGVVSTGNVRFVLFLLLVLFAERPAGRESKRADPRAPETIAATVFLRVPEGTSVDRVKTH